MTANNPLRIGIKYLAFISPILILFTIGFLAFHTLILAGTFTLVMGAIFLICLAYYVERSGKFTREIQKKYNQYKR